jgi:hypothetical protein
MIRHPHPGKESIDGTAFEQVTEPLASLTCDKFSFAYTYNAGANLCFSITYSDKI